MSLLVGLDATFRRWDVPVVGTTLVPGRPGAFAPTHVMVHHTAAPAGSGAVPSLRVVREGRRDLPGPLCHVLVGRDLRVRVISLGKANHAGAGQYPGIPEDQGNTRAVGIEIEHAGTSREAWSPVYVAFCDLVTAAVLDHIGQPATRLCAHKEYAPTRKIDPYGWDMDDRRRAVARILAVGPQVDVQPAAKERDMFKIARVSDGRLFILDGVGKRLITKPRADVLVRLGWAEVKDVGSDLLAEFPTYVEDGTHGGSTDTALRAADDVPGATS